MVAVALLIAAAAGMVAWSRRPAIVPIVAAVAGLATTAVSWHDAADALGVMRDPLLFLVVAVPLAVALDDLGVFEALAASVDGGRHLVLGLWLLAAAVTIVFNLDAAVVLLTPLYIRIARRHGLPPEALAFVPVLLACLASHPLPVSNLTNLVVAEQLDVRVDAFVRALGPATVVAVTVGWLAYRRVFPAVVAATPIDVPVDRRALARGLPVVAFVLVGFTLGPEVGIAPWVVGAAALVATVAIGARRIPWRAVPVEAIAIAAALTVLVAGALPHLGLERLLDGGGAWGRLQALLVGAIGADATNNLPTVLAATPSLTRAGQAWPLLLGANMAPVLVLTGALSGLLWRDTCRRLGVTVTARRYAAVGARIGLPALLLAGALVVWAP